MAGGLTRRALLLGLARGRVLPPETHRYADPLTEFPIERLTSPAYASWLPLPHCRAAARRGGFVIYGSEREGRPQLYRLEHKTGASRQLIDAAALDRTSFTLLPGDTNLLYFDGRSLRSVALKNLKDRELYTVRHGWERAPGLTVTEDAAFVIETRDGVSEVRAVSLEEAEVRTVFSSAEPIVEALPRPASSEILCRRDALWIGERRLPTAEGRIGPVYWRPDGGAVLYLRTDRDGRTEIRETDADQPADRLVAPASRFVHFAPNGDGTVFVGASGSIAQPHIMLLLRSTRRELTICEHRARDPRIAQPVFSPDSQRIYFVSDAAGKPALHSMTVDRLVEGT